MLCKVKLRGNKLHLPIYLFALAFWAPTIWAFDDDRSISNTDLKSETFLDINAHSFRKSQNLEWLNVVNGFRIAGGSTSTNRLFTFSELKLNRPISEHLNVGLNLEQKEFYADKPVERPQLAVDIYPINDIDIGFSVIGTVAHDKRQADLGYALTWGRQPEQYLRFSWLKVDVFHNDKNEFDDSVYEEFGETLKLEGLWQFNDKYTLNFELEKDRPLDFVSNGGTSRFQHERYDHQISLYYHPKAHSVWGAILRNFEIDKSLSETDFDQSQGLDYLMADFFNISHIEDLGEFTLGLRYDEFKDKVADRSSSNEGSDFDLKTIQLYGNLYREFATNHAWDLGVYIGHSERTLFTENLDTLNENESGVEAKLRGTWEYKSADNKSALGFSLTLNLDDLIEDPGDGGGIYFRTEL